MGDLQGKALFLRAASLAAISLLLFKSPSNAVPPLEGRTHPDSPVCFVNQQAAKGRLAAMAKSKMGFAPPIAATTYKIAVIRIDFSDKTQKKTFSQTTSLFSKFKDFYSENSYGVLTVTAAISNGGTGAKGAFRMPRSHGYYAHGIYSFYETLVQDALQTASAGGFDFTPYDHVILYHAGDGAETSHDFNIWSAYLPSDYLNGGPKVQGKTFNGIAVLPETQGLGVDPFGTICHEYGHQLGLPDLYNTATSESAIGIWSLMDFGSYAGYPMGANPSHLDAWSKLFLGFSSPETISSSGNFSRVLSQAESDRRAFLRIPAKNSSVSSDQEYFLVEYRRRSGAAYDQGLPAEGVLIWHVDDSIALNPDRLKMNSVNAGSPHLGVSLVPAAASTPASNWKDPWSKSFKNASFIAPKNNNFNGKNSGVEMDDFSSAGGPTMSLTVRSLLNNPVFASNTARGSVVIAGGVGGLVNPDRGEIAQIGIVPEDSSSVRIKIFNVSGELINEMFSNGSANLQRFVSWDGKDAEGRSVGSGIYFVKIEGGGIDMVKKVAVIK